MLSVFFGPGLGGSALDDVMVDTCNSCWQTNPVINQSTDWKVLRYVSQMMDVIGFTFCFIEKTLIKLDLRCKSVDFKHLKKLWNFVICEFF